LINIRIYLFSYQGAIHRCPFDVFFDNIRNKNEDRSKSEEKNL